MPHKPSKSAENVLQILDHASTITLKYFKTEFIVENKGGDAFDPLTLADKESDAYIRKSLHELFPNDLLLTEESSDIPETYEGRVWMVDPLDGTKCFVSGTDNFSINIGLVENGIPIFGCVAIPAQGKVYYAEKGMGAFEKVGDNFYQVETSPVHEIEKARLITRVSGEDIRPVEEKLNILPFSDRKAGGGIGDKLCQIVAGLAEANINTNMRVSKWDTAGPQIILEEAGGVVSDFDGNPIDYKSKSVRLERSFIASANLILHSVILKELRRLGI